jgi:hypothetical protein
LPAASSAACSARGIKSQDSAAFISGEANSVEREETFAGVSARVNGGDNFTLRQDEVKVDPDDKGERVTGVAAKVNTGSTGKRDTPSFGKAKSELASRGAPNKVTKSLSHARDAEGALPTAKEMTAMSETLDEAAHDVSFMLSQMLRFAGQQPLSPMNRSNDGGGEAHALKALPPLEQRVQSPHANLREVRPLKKHAVLSSVFL